MTVHAKLSPSASGRWLTCPGSVKLAEGVTRAPSASLAADEGTAAHELLEHCLLNHTDPHDAELSFITVGENKFPIDLDMRNAVNSAYEWVQSYLADNPEATLHCEERVDPGAWLLRDDLFGTSDIIIDNYSASELVIGDYKHGKGISVDVEHNTQMLIYTLGKALPDLTRYTTYRLVILQPRARHKDGPIREWIITQKELQDFLKKELEKALDIIDAIAVGEEQVNDHLHPSEKACQFCDAKPICSELAEHNLSVARGEFQDLDDVNPDAPPFLVRPNTLTPDQLDYILRNAKLIQTWLKSVEAHCYLQLQRGGVIGDFKLVKKKSNRVFTLEGDDLVTRLRSFGLKLSDIYAPRKPLGPAPIEALIKAMDDEEIKSSFYEIVEKPDTGLTMVPGKDPRPAVEPEARPTDEFDDEEMFD